MLQGISDAVIEKSAAVDCQDTIFNGTGTDRNRIAETFGALRQFVGPKCLICGNGNGVIRHISQPGKIVDQESCIGAASGKSEINDGSGTNRDPGPGVDAEFPFVSTAAGDSKPST